jgi:hypothetical protein
MGRAGCPPHKKDVTLVGWASCPPCFLRNEQKKKQDSSLASGELLNFNQFIDMFSKFC